MADSEQAAPAVSAVIPSYNTADATVRACRSAFEHTQLPLQVIVVDDCSIDGTPERLAAECPLAEVIVQPRRSGFAAAVNAGISRAQAALILLLNSDIVVGDDAIDRMAAFLRDSGADACGCRLIDPEGRPQPYSTRVPNIGRAVGAALGGRAVPQEPPAGPGEVECLQGSCLMMTRELAERTGQWDEGFFVYCEDIDWCIRARAAGGRLHYLPDVTMTHVRGLSTSQDVHRMTWHYHRSLWRLYRKHFAAEHGALFNCLMLAGLIARGAATMLANAVRRNKRPRW